MAETFSKLGTAGVILTEEEYASSSGSLENAQNAELVLDEEKGGDPSLSKRGGVVPLGDAFGGGIVEMHELRFISEL